MEESKEVSKIDSRQLRQRFFAFVRPHRRWLTIAGVGNFITVAIVMVSPLLVKFIIDEAIPARNVGLLIGLGSLMIALTFLRHAVGYGHVFLLNYVGQRIVFDIRKTLFHHLQLLHLSFYEQEKAASLVNRVIHDVAAIQNFINQAFNTMANSIVALVMAVGIMLVLNWKLTLYCLLTLPLYFVVLHWFRARLYAQSHDLRQRQSALAGMLGETFMGIKVVKSFGAERQEERRFVSTISNNFSPELEFSMLGYRMSGALGILTDTTYAVILLCGGWVVIGGGMTVGTLVAFTTYLMMLFGPVQSFSGLLHVAINARTGFERVLQLLDIRPKVTSIAHPVKLPAMRGQVVFEQVGFSYGELPTIQNFSLDVSPGEVIALVGPSGSGKSTIVSLLTRFHNPLEGRILIDGVDLTRLDYDLYRKQIGIVLQDSFLFSGTIEENLRYGKPDATMDELRAVAHEANALGFIEELPNDFRTRVGEGGAMLSGGQRQRIAIARAILKNPRILIFDEATSALDTESEALIQESLDRLMKGKTVFVVAHRLSTIQKATRIVVMDRGRIEEVGTHTELLARRGMYHRLHQPRLVEPAAQAG